eukprot:TRINITY_DN2270_c0_g1_i6.p1 TRINITY_DN2270_c0_g1~~TRINITY_DN2270_c0_g1_i6.p1  ORF type:complete len:673 (+),score=87.86 TRINITY_DN2270_c0_g1_i6:210-2228(+)
MELFSLSSIPKSLAKQSTDFFSLHFDGSTYIQGLGVSLRVPQITIAQAILLFHKFCLRHEVRPEEIEDYGRGCINLAIKIQDTPHPRGLMGFGVAENIEEPQLSAYLSRIADTEHKILMSLGTTLVAHDWPYVHLLNLLKKLFPDSSTCRSLAQNSWNFVNDSLRTTLWLIYPSQLIAVAALGLGIKMVKDDQIPKPEGCRTWELKILQELSLDILKLKEVSEIQQQILDLYRTDDSNIGLLSTGNLRKVPARSCYSGINQSHGSSICNYLFYEQIWNEENYGIAWQALERDTQRDVIIKKVRSTSTISGTVSLCSVRELNSLNSLRHENIIKIVSLTSYEECDSKNCVSCKQPYATVSITGDNVLSDDNLENELRNLGHDIKRVKSYKYLTEIQFNSHESLRKFITSPVIEIQDTKISVIDFYDEFKREPEEGINMNEESLDNYDDQYTFPIRSIFIVFEGAAYNLGHHIMKYGKPTLSFTWSVFKQLLLALDYLHKSGVMHRDLKTTNILMTEDHRVKLFAFDLSRQITKDTRYTNKIYTLWYRPPEILLGATKYSSSSDMWSAGVIFAEMLLGKNLFTDGSEFACLGKMFALLGAPTEESWPDLANLPHSHIITQLNVEGNNTPHFSAIFRGIPGDAEEVLKKILVLDPSKRISAREALALPFFQSNVG